MWVDDFSFGERHLCVLDSTKDLCYFTITAMNNFVISAGLTKKVAKAVCATIETDMASSDPEEVFTKKKHLKGPLKTQTTNKQIA